MPSLQLSIFSLFLFFLFVSGQNQAFYGTDETLGPVLIASSNYTPIYPAGTFTFTRSGSGALDATNGVYYHIVYNLTTNTPYVWATDLKSRSQIFAVELPFSSLDRAYPDQAVTIDPLSGNIYIFGSNCQHYQCNNQSLIQLNAATQELTTLLTINNFYKPYSHQPIIDPVNHKYIFMAQTGRNQQQYNLTLWSIDLNSLNNPPVQIVLPTNYYAFTILGLIWDGASQQIWGTVDIGTQPYVGSDYIATISCAQTPCLFKTTVQWNHIEQYRSSSIAFAGDSKGNGYTIMNYSYENTPWLISINFAKGQESKVMQLQSQDLVQLVYSPQQW